ncbi:MAG TPA: PAS domain S-box protein [Devosia sp.]|nr:PAS domain S-box protein [Devosia sp.]
MPAAITGLGALMPDRPQFGTAPARDAFLTEEARYKLLVHALTDYAVFMLDANGYVASWNAGAERIKGYTAEEILGRHFSRFYTEEDRASGLPARALATAAAEGRFELEGWRVRKDGSRFWANVVIDPVRDETGELVGFAKVTRDMTERRAAQQALEETRAAFFQAQKMEAIGQLTGGVAHDFNNLLTAVIGSLEMLRKRLPEDARSHQLLDNALEGARRGVSLTQRMLAFARRQELAPTAVDLPGLVNGMAALLQRSVGPEINICTRFDPGLKPVVGDANQLELALLNLAVNARDASPNGGTIDIAASNEQVTPGHPTGLPPGDYVRLAVTDHGAGMDADTLARATEPFFTTKGVGKGTGLGLSMVHGLAEQLGGRLVLHSRPDAGTTAEIWLRPAENMPEAPAGPAPDAAGEEPRPTVARTILAVDDDGLVLMNTAAMIEDMGHRVIEATTGKKALEILEQEPGIDLLITDQAMPQMTGLQLAQEAARLRPGLPVVIATGYAELPQSTGNFVKLDKPFFAEQLEAAINAALKA